MSEITTASVDSARTTSISIKFTASIPRPRSRETVEALQDVVRSGEARYVGASSMDAWQFAKMLHVAEQNGWTKFARRGPTTTCCTEKRSGRCCRSVLTKASG